MFISPSASAAFAVAATAWGTVRAVENVMGIEVPRRAAYLRTIWIEMSRLHSHLLWAGTSRRRHGI